MYDQFCRIMIAESNMSVWPTDLIIDASLDDSASCVVIGFAVNVFMVRKLLIFTGKTFSDICVFHNSDGRFRIIVDDLSSSNRNSFKTESGHWMIFLQKLPIVILVGKSAR